MSGISPMIESIERAMHVAPSRTLPPARDRVSAARWEHGGGVAEDLWLKDHILVLDYAGNRSIRLRGKTEIWDVAPGTVSMIRNGDSGTWDVPSCVHLFHVYLSDSVLRHAAAQHGMDPRMIDVIEVYSLQDALLAGAMTRLDAALDAGSSASMYASTLGLTIALCALEKFTNLAGGRNISVRGGLSPRTLTRAIDFMNAHLGEALTLDLVASELGISAKHFARAFRESKGVPPHQWLLARRIERAKELLTAREQSLSEVAMECGFADQSHFTATFRKAVGLTPLSYRNERQS